MVATSLLNDKLYRFHNPLGIELASSDIALFVNCQETVAFLSLCTPKWSASIGLIPTLIISFMEADIVEFLPQKNRQCFPYLNFCAAHLGVFSRILIISECDIEF